MYRELQLLCRQGAYQVSLWVYFRYKPTYIYNSLLPNAYSQWVIHLCLHEIYLSKYMYHLDKVIYRHMMVHRAEIIAEYTTKITDLENEVAWFSRPVQYFPNQALFNQCKAQDSSKMVPKVCISQEKQPPSIDCGRLICVHILGFPFTKVEFQHHKNNNSLTHAEIRTPTHRLLMTNTVP